MVKSPVRRKIDKRLNAAKRKLFFAHLSETANVAASARVAGISSTAVYAERRRSPQFKAAWSEALTEGYCPQRRIRACGQGWHSSAMAA